MLHNVFCIDGDQNYFDFNPSDTSVWPGGKSAFTSASWHRMEYKQVGIPGSTKTKYSITVNDIEIFTKASFRNLTPTRFISENEKIEYSSPKTQLRKIQRHVICQIYHCTTVIIRIILTPLRMQTVKLEIWFGKNL